MALTKQVLKEEIQNAFKKSEEAALDGDKGAQNILVEELANGFINALKKLDQTNLIILGANQGGPLKVESITLKIS